MSKIKISVKMKPPPTQATCTLNGQILTCWSDGRIFRESGRIDQQGLVLNKPDIHGYCPMKINQKTYKMHRVIYYTFYPNWNITDNSRNNGIDHIDGNRSNNRLDNLREATNRQNTYNTGATVKSRTGIKGICPVYDKKDNYWQWHISINIGGKTVFRKRRKAGDGHIPDILPDVPQDLIDLCKEKQKFYHGEFFHE